MAYNITAFDSTETVYDTLTVVNQNTNYMYATGILVLIFLLILLVYRKRPFKEVLIYDSAVTTLLSALLVAIQWVPFDYLMLPSFLLFMSIIINVFGRD